MSDVDIVWPSLGAIHPFSTNVINWSTRVSPVHSNFVEIDFFLNGRISGHAASNRI